MPEQEESTTEAAASLLGHIIDLESQLKRLPQQKEGVTAIELWRKTETLLTDYISTVVKLVQIEPLALFAGLPGRKPLPALDLTLFSEATRQVLYAATVATHWDAPREHPDDFIPSYRPDEAGLQIVYLFGHWWAIWRMLEEPQDVPESQRWEILRIEADASSPYGVSFTGA